MCDRDRDDLALLAAGLLGEPAAGELEAHVRRCPECAAELERWQALSVAVRRDVSAMGLDLPPLAPVVAAAEDEAGALRDARRKVAWFLAAASDLASARRAVRRPALAGALVVLLLAVAFTVVRQVLPDVVSPTVTNLIRLTGWEPVDGRAADPAGAARMPPPTVVGRSSGQSDGAGADRPRASAGVELIEIGRRDAPVADALGADASDAESWRDGPRRSEASEAELVVVIVDSVASAVPTAPTAPAAPTAPTAPPDEPGAPPPDPTSSSREPTAGPPPRPTGEPPSEPTGEPPGPTAVEPSPTAGPTPVPTRAPVIVSGQVTGPDGRGRAEVWVVAELDPDSGEVQVGVHTDASGAYRLELPSEGPWMLHVESPAYRLQWHSGQASPFSADRVLATSEGIQPVDFPLERQPDGVLAGQVTRSDGSPAERAMIVALSAEGDAREPVAVAFSYFDGSFELFLGPGDFKLGVSPDGASWPVRWWEDAGTASDADPISLLDGERLDGFGFSLP